MKINITIPTSWNELSQKQFSNIVHQLETYQRIIKDSPQVVAETSAKLYLQLSKELLRNNSYKNIRRVLNEIHPKEFIKWTKFLYAKISRTKFKQTITIDKHIFYGPGIRFRNATIAEFSYVDAVWYKWRMSQQEIWLDVLCAALYREHYQTKWQRFINKLFPTPVPVDIRAKFLKQTVDARADIFGKLATKEKLAIAYTYEGCRNHIAKTFPHVFPEPVKVDGKVVPTLSNNKYVSFGEIILDKIKGDPSKLADTNNVLVYDFLAIVEKDIKDFNKRPKQ